MSDKPKGPYNHPLAEITRLNGVIALLEYRIAQFEIVTESICILANSTRETILTSPGVFQRGDDE